jgi:hypothetical protein
MLPTARVMPRRTLPGYWWAGLGTIPALSRDETMPALPESTPSHQNCLTARRACARCEAAVPPVGCIIIPVFLRDALLGALLHLAEELTTPKYCFFGFLEPNFLGHSN